LNKLLIISYSFPPSNSPAAQRPYFFAKYVDPKKIKTFVLSPSTADSSLGYSNAYKDDKPTYVHVKYGNVGLKNFRSVKQKENAASANTRNRLIRNIKIRLVSFLSKLVYPDKGMFWIPYGVIKALRIIDKSGVDFIYSTSPLMSNHIIGLIVSRLREVKWIVDFRDYHYIENREFSKGVRKYIDRYIELKALRVSYASIFISDAMREEYVLRYPFIKDSAHSIYNGFDLDEFSLFTNSKKEGPVRIFYAGSFYKGLRSPEPLLRTIDAILDEGLIELSDINIEIAGNFDNNLISDISSLKSFGAIDFLGLIPRRDVLKKYVEADLLWLIVGEKKSHYTGFPVKGYEYIASGTSIMVFTPEDSEPEKIVVSLGCGKRFTNGVESRDIEVNKQILLSMIRNIPFERGNRRDLSSIKFKKYQRQYQAIQLERLLQENQSD